MLDHPWHQKIQIKGSYGGIKKTYDFLKKWIFWLNFFLEGNTLTCFFWLKWKYFVSWLSWINKTYVKRLASGNIFTQNSFFFKKWRFGQFSEPIIWRSQIDQNKIHYLGTFVVPILHKTAKKPMLIVCQAEKSYSQVAKKSVFLSEISLFYKNSDFHFHFLLDANKLTWVFMF